jgi:hypothetical protein
MLFHVAASADAKGVVGMTAAMKSTLDEMKAEGVVLSACSGAHSADYFFIVEAGDAHEAASEIDRLSRTAPHPLSINVTEVRPA